MKKAFTLTELLVVIAIVAILAAILFPVFAQAKLAAKKSVDLSNMKQLGTAFVLYAGDNDDYFPLMSFPSSGNTWNLRCQPYIKNFDIFRSPADAATTWPPAGIARPTIDTPQGDPRWGYRWTSYLLNGYVSGDFGGSGTYATTSSIKAPANLIVLALAADDVFPRDHFMPAFWGVPAEFPDTFMMNATFDPATNRTKELKLEAFGNGKNFAYADSHAKFGRWNQVWWRDVPNGIYAGSFDPRNEGR
jgi:prepilin-type N-terminal cleavage/methylation domain-containing protein